MSLQDVWNEQRASRRAAVEDGEVTNLDAVHNNVSS